MSTSRRPARHQGHAGFTMVELLLVVTIIGIVASIAYPRINGARAASNEGSTINSLRAIQTAQATYAASCAGGAYAPTIARLAMAPAAGRPAFIGPGFTADTINRNGYRIRFSAGPRMATAPATCNGLAAGQAVTAWFAEAAPLTAGSGTRYFGVSQRGVIYQSRVRVAPNFASDPPAPARPIQ